MPTANRDSSELTRKRKAMALYAYSSQIRANGVYGSTPGRKEQTSEPTLDVVTAARQGGCYCTAANSANPYDFVGCGPCGGGNQ